jgi:hypothetical protein
MVSTGEMEAGREEEPLYDHSVPRHPGLGFALLVSLFFPGAGQAVKGNFRRFMLIWIVILAGTADLVGAAVLLRPGLDPMTAISGMFGIMYGLGLIYSVFDLTARP